MEDGRDGPVTFRIRRTYLSNKADKGQRFVLRVVTRVIQQVIQLPTCNAQIGHAMFINFPLQTFRGLISRGSRLWEASAATSSVASVRARL